jgi:hypothetical protein
MMILSQIAMAFTSPLPAGERSDRIELANRFELSDFRPVHLFCERHHTSERRWIVTFGDGQRELD